jgi:hypothetical protein
LKNLAQSSKYNAGGKMAKYGFSTWKTAKNNIIVENLNNTFVNLPHKKGDLAYFGIHDLSRRYRENGCLPSLSLFDIFDKKGEIVDLDPVNQTIILSLDKPPFNYGYRKIESERDKERRYMRDDGKIELKIPIYNLQNITHIMDDDTIPIWLVIDGNTNYQKELIKAIRRKERVKSELENLPQPPTTRHYDGFEGDELCIEEPEELQVAHFDPSILSKTRVWKQFKENNHYRYYPES